MSVLRPLDQVLTAKRRPNLMIPEDFPTLEDKGVRVSVIAGTASLNGKRELSPIPTLVPVYFLHICLEKGKVSHVVRIPTSFEGFVYCLKGSGFVNGQRLRSEQAAMMGEPWPCEDETDSTENIRIVSTHSEGMQVLLIAGTPLKQDGDQYESFVRRVRDEILQVLGVTNESAQLESPALLYEQDDNISELGDVDYSPRKPTETFHDPTMGPIVDRRSMMIEKLARRKRSVKAVSGSWFEGVFKQKGNYSTRGLSGSRLSCRTTSTTESDDETSATSLGSRLF